MDAELVKPLLYWLGVGVFLLLELRFSYRPATVSKWQRWRTNIPLSIINGLTYQFLYGAAIVALLAYTDLQKVGLLQVLGLSYWPRVAAGVLLLDFTIYVWHLLTHKVPLLWRFHRVHHSDLNMDVSTANRFHLGEFLVSGLVRLAAIFTFGIPLLAYLLFEMLVNLAIQFHHSSLAVPESFDRLWRVLFVPPSLHRIHHSVKIKERDANYGVIFSLWDRGLGTLLTDVDQVGIVIGIGSHRQFDQLGFRHLWKMPFKARTL